MRKKKTIRVVNSVCNVKSPAVAPIQVDDKNRKVSSVVESLLLPGQRGMGRLAIFDRLYTTVVLIACIVTAGVFVTRAWEKFSMSPIVVNVETTNYPLYKLQFPAVTICPANTVKKTIGEGLLSRYLNISLDSELRKDLWNVMSALAKCQYPFYFRMQEHLQQIRSLLPQFADFNVSRFMLQVMPTCSELLDRCFWMGNEVNCCDIFNLQRTEAGFCYSFNSLTSEKTWNCAGTDEFFRPSKTFKESNESSKCEPRHNIASGTTTGLEVFLKPSKPEDSLQDGQRDKTGTRVYLHLPVQLPEAGTGVLMPEEQAKVFSVEVTPSVTESSLNVRALSVSQRQCLFPDERRLSVFNTYTEKNCLLECRLTNIARFCGCLPYFFSAFTVELRIFKPPKGAPGFENITAIDCADCLPTCHDNRYDIHYSYKDDGNPYAKGSGGYLDVFYKDVSAIKYRQQLAFDVMDLVVSFGGVVSLFLGISLLGVFQFICLCTLRCVMVYQYMRQNTDIHRQAWIE